METEQAEPLSQKDKVAAAIARAKAKKATMKAGSDVNEDIDAAEVDAEKRVTGSAASTEVDDKKAKIAAAVARAKAKKAVQQSGIVSEDQTPAPQAPEDQATKTPVVNTPVAERESSTVTPSPEDDKKARVAAAVARAKAKKAAAQADSSEVAEVQPKLEAESAQPSDTPLKPEPITELRSELSSEPSHQLSPEDEKKAKIAAAVARAKAKKAARAVDATSDSNE